MKSQSMTVSAPEQQPRQEPAAPGGEKAKKAPTPPRVRRRLSAEEINPYTRHVHEHPEVLLAEPTPEALRERLLAASTGQESPGLVLDLGCGSGNFLLEMARNHPELRFVGFELRFKRLVKGARKVEKEGLRNVWLLRERAERFPAYFDPPLPGLGGLERVHVNFPDPWPRAGDRAKRLVSQGFLDDLARMLSPRGSLCFKTDHSGYFLHVLSLLERRPDWRLRVFRNDLLRRPLATPTPRSEFEQLFRSKGRPIHYLELEKTGTDR